jgi:hypothetical protein
MSSVMVSSFHGMASVQIQVSHPIDAIFGPYLVKTCMGGCPLEASLAQGLVKQP